MKIIYNDNAKKWAEGYALLEHATARLEEIIGSSADLVTVEWNGMLENGYPPAYRLTLRDFTGEAQATLTVQELRSSSYMRVLLHRLWGDVLKVHSDQQHRKVQALVQEQEGG
jgi:hypothetical protein